MLSIDLIENKPKHSFQCPKKSLPHGVMWVQWHVWHELMLLVSAYLWIWSWLVFALAYLPCCRFFVFSAKRTKVYMSYIRLSWIQMTVILTRQIRYLEFSKGIWLGGPDQIAFVKLCRTVHINHVDVLLFWRWVGTKLKKKWELVSKQSFSVPLWSDALTLEKFIPAKLYSSLSLSDRVHAIGSRSWKSLEFD